MELACNFDKFFIISLSLSKPHSSYSLQRLSIIILLHNLGWWYKGSSFPFWTPSMKESHNWRRPEPFRFVVFSHYTTQLSRELSKKESPYSASNLGKFWCLPKCLKEEDIHYLWTHPPRQMPAVFSSKRAINKLKFLIEIEDADSEHAVGFCLFKTHERLRFEERYNTWS